MSASLQLKKLRGSGGYIRALITDQQQSKGNLGGPDLFLAPIGRLDVESIKKYSCNTCDKEYDGSPKIEFENPNEEVAENLILAERGQYQCTVCDSLIAEYRVFSKSDELAEVGNAKPLEAKEEIIQESMDVPQHESMDVPQHESMDVPQHESDSYRDRVDDFTGTETKPVDSSFSAIPGKLVFDENAKRIGIAKQVGVDSNNIVVLIMTDNDCNDVSINWNRIKKVGEIILLGVSNAPSKMSEQEGFRCTNCNFENKPDSRFCERCGNEI
jgi:sporulation protein YlmC with PRC-barrel domain